MTLVSEEYDESANMDESGMPGPGAPTPLTALEVRCNSKWLSHQAAISHYWCPFLRSLLTSDRFFSQGVAGLTKRDIQLIIDGGYNTVESVAYTPKRMLEQIKGISEQKAGKILTEGTLRLLHCPDTVT